MAPTPNDQQQPWWQRAAAAGAQAATAAQDRTAAGPMQGGGPQMQPPPSKPNPWVQLAQGAGKFGTALKGKLSDAPGTGTPEGPPPINPDGSAVDMAADGKVFTKPTLVVMGEQHPEAAVPLGYRSTAKTRPSMAQPVKPQGRQYYGG